MYSWFVFGSEEPPGLSFYHLSFQSPGRVSSKPFGLKIPRRDHRLLRGAATVDLLFHFPSLDRVPRTPASQVFLSDTCFRIRPRSDHLSYPTSFFSTTHFSRPTATSTAIPPSPAPNVGDAGEKKTVSDGLKRLSYYPQLRG